MPYHTHICPTNQTCKQFSYNLPPNEKGLVTKQHVLRATSDQGKEFNFVQFSGSSIAALMCFATDPF